MSESKQQLTDLQPGQIVRVHQSIKEGDKTRTQIFEGLVIARKGGRGVSGTFTVRKVSDGIAVERIFPRHSPLFSKIDVVRTLNVRRAKLYHLRQPNARLPREKKATK